MNNSAAKSDFVPAITAKLDSIRDLCDYIQCYKAIIPADSGLTHSVLHRLLNADAELYAAANYISTLQKEVSK